MIVNARVWSWVVDEASLIRSDEKLSNGAYRRIEALGESGMKDQPNGGPRYWVMTGMKRLPNGSVYLGWPVHQ
jgi:hypothetical protein